MKPWTSRVKQLTASKCAAQAQTLSRAAGSPDVMTRHCLLAAASGRPKTGADRNSSARALPRSASLVGKAGSTVEQLMKMVPRAACGQ